jgi:outer membrane protein OmpA-like peptidoglycan-associated protein
MGDSDGSTIHSDENGAFSATHPPQPELSLLAGTTTTSEFNTAHLAVFPIACYKMENLHFVFDSSILSPDLPVGIQQLKALLDLHSQPTPGSATAKITPPVSIFGHADPVGSDDYNKSLSGRRAASVYALLTRRPEIWEDLYSNGGQYAINGATGDQWGTRSIQTMLNAVAPSNSQPLAVDGQQGPKTSAAIQQFQSSQGLSADGNPGAGTRKALFLAYMEKICLGPDGQPFQLDPKKDFLGHNTDPSGKADYQGCSEFNPVMLYSQSDLDYFAQETDKTGRNAGNAVNRRVMVLLYQIGAQVTASKWPCPKATEGIAGCKKRFWSNGEQRRTNGPEQRLYEDKHDTFACRFYQRQMTGSPCERGKLPAARVCSITDEVFFGVE